MEKSVYANLHHKTHYSCGIAIGTCKDSIVAAKEKELAALAITDYCSISGILDFLDEGKKQDFNVILGVEINYVDEWNQSFNIVLLLKNNKGYQNLCRIISSAQAYAYKYDKPTCLLSDLRDFSEGVVCVAGGPDGPWSQHWLRSDMESSPRATVNDLKDIFQDDFYLEFCQSNQMYQWNDKFGDYVQKFTENPHKLANKELLKFADESNTKVIISSDSSIPNEEDKILQDVIVRTSARGKRGFYVRETKAILRVDELEARIAVEHIGISHKRLNRYFEATLEIAEKCQNPALVFKDQLVKFPIVTHTLHQDGMDKHDLLWEIIRSNGRIDFSNPIYSKRIEYEIGVIKDNSRMDLTDYFLVVEDLCRACRENEVIVGPGRGSGAGSLLNYALMITHLDPILYGLIFERFISQGRIENGSMPDIDLDFSDQKWAKQYLVDKYGVDRVMPIGTFQTMGTKSAIKDAFKLYYPQLDFKSVNKITKKFGKKDEGESEVEFFNRSIEGNESIQEDLFTKYPKAGECIERLIGFNRQMSVHPCGMTITQDPLDTVAPGRYYKGSFSLDFNGDTCERVGILKYDILSIVVLRYFGRCVELIKERHDIDIDIYNIPTDDMEVFAQFDKGNTDGGIFQFGSDIAKGILTKIKSRSLEDGSMVTAVGRPGPMANEQHLEFIKRVNGESESIAPHPALEETLKETYGIMIYQESVMRVSQILGGFSLAEADDIRKAMGKKKAKLLRPYKSRFIDYASENFDDIDKIRAESIWRLMETFSGYGFNKCLSGDTVIQRGNGCGIDGSREWSIEDLYLIRNDFLHAKSINKVHYHKKLKRHGYGNILAPDNDGRIRPRSIKNIVQSGIKEVYRVTTSTGKSIKGTLSHRLSTDRGDLEISQLMNIPEVKLSVNGGYEKETKHRTIHIGTGLTHKNKNYKPTKGTKGFAKGQLNHGYIDGNHTELFKRKGELVEQKSCSHCGIYFSLSVKPEHHHVDGNAINNKLGNIVKLCNSCHKKADYKIGKRIKRYSKGYLIKHESIISIEYVGKEMTYDIEMEDSPNLFVANDIISHNSHSISYTYIGYICMYFKVHYPLEWYCACLEHSVAKPDKFYEIFQAGQDYIFLPDINHSTNKFYIRDGKVQLPFNCIKGVGEKANEEIEKARPYTSMQDFYKRVYKRVVKKDVVEKLIFADCFQSWGTFPEMLRMYYEDLRKEELPEKYLHLNREQKLNLRSKALDFIVLDYYELYPKIFNDPDYLSHLDKLHDKAPGEIVIIGGKVIEKKIIITKRKKEKMAKVKIQNGRDTIIVTVWPDELKAWDSKIQVDNVLYIQGKIDFFNNMPQVLATHINTLEEALNAKDQWSYK